ncbi:CPBP family glutamic-type intramembrane protease [Williamwhitmania taraxaci]|uniref:CAAX protease self-immunity n=1 Tax=Williamwhitmania taraxaci TaxID=1640674 RepID=A0A1G6SH25_9BACT|nr:CPBP family glutamic-type intramembrane protease [Williamwhitmania taraxaci]SDD16212.1 CAAX protease self-immunity [Williamwhitmania taraxaci]
MNDFIHFIKKPKYSESCKKINWKIFFLLLFVLFLLSLALGPVTRILIYVCGFNNAVPTFILPKKILLIIVLAPIVEELFFRLLLIFKKRNLYIYLLCCTLLGIWYSINGSDTKLVLIVAIAIACIIAITYYDQCKLAIVKRYGFFFYFIAVVFGLVHISNFDGITFHNFIFTPFIVLPQLMMGVIFGYIRVTYGIAYSILFHAMVNIPFVLSLL